MFCIKLLHPQLLHWVGFISLGREQCCRDVVMKDGTTHYGDGQYL